MITLQVQAFKRWLKVPVGKLIPETMLAEKIFGEDMLKLLGMTKHVCNMKISTILVCIKTDSWH